MSTTAPARPTGPSEPAAPRHARPGPRPAAPLPPATPPAPTGERRPAAAAAFRLLWPIALLVLGALMAANAWHRLSTSLLFVLVAVVPMLLLQGALKVGISRWVASSLLVLLIVLGAYLLTAGAGLSLEHTVRDSVPRLLTAPLPYVPAADLLVGPLLLTALVSLFVGLRIDGPTRVVPVAGGAVLYVTGALLTAGSADPWGLVAVLMLVVALLGWVFLDEHSEPVRARLVVAAPLSVIAVGAIAAVATVPAHDPFQPRTLVDPPTVDVVSNNPLTQLGAWAVNPTTPLMRVRGDAVPLRLVVLDDYDGEQWTASTSYAQVGTDGSTGLTDATPYARTSTVQVEMTGLGGNWLPSPGTPLLVGARSALVDPGTGTLFATDPDATNDYEVAGVYDQPPERALQGAQISQGDFYDHYTQLPDLPPVMAAYAKRVVAGAVSPYQRAVTLADRLRHDYTFSPKAISGSALWRLQNFLVGGKTEAGARVGTSEQFAAAFAVLARYDGLPTRVVVGFKPGEPDTNVDDPSAPDGTDGSRIVTGADALAWAEVYFDGLGWVAFSPTPDDDTFPNRKPVQADQPDLPDPVQTAKVTPEPSSSVTVAPPTGSGATPPAASPSGSLPSWLPYAAGGALVGGALVVLLTLRWARRLRHRRLGAPGAWLEVVDALRLAGLAPSAHESADQVADSADLRFTTSSAGRIAALAQRDAFAPEPVARAAARGLDRDVRAVRRGSRRAVPLWRRWWWFLDPRVFARTATLEPR